MVTGLLTALTLLAFAANSLLCRMALGGESIDPLAFTAIRLASGAAILLPVSRISSEVESRESHGSWSSALVLFGYAIAFSLAYISLDTGMGALILFGAVQATMIGAGLKSGERPHPLQWAGLTAALGGLVFLVSPGLTAPDPPGAMLMTIAGISWGIYSLRGKRVAAPVMATAGNFFRTVPLALAAAFFGYGMLYVETKGVMLALISGSVTSGLGYVLWYKALKGLSTTKAAMVQLLVPVIAAFGGVAVLSEQISWRLVLASLLILGGVAMAVVSREKLT